MVGPSPQLDMTRCLHKYLFIYHLPLHHWTNIERISIKITPWCPAFLCMPCFAFFGSSALISQTGSRRVIPDQGLLCWQMPYLLFSSLGTSALWGPRLMCDDVYCLLICPFSGYQGPERDRSCGGAIKGGRFRVILWFVRMIPHKTKKESHCFAHFRSGICVVWNSMQVEGDGKHRHPCECILRIWNVFVRSPVLISKLHKSVILHIKHWVV